MISAQHIAEIIIMLVSLMFYSTCVSLFCALPTPCMMSNDVLDLNS